MIPFLMTTVDRHRPEANFIQDDLDFTETKECESRGDYPFIITTKPRPRESGHAACN